jgi:hypothetical protein
VPADFGPLAERVADFIRPQLGPGEAVEALLDQSRAGPPTWSGDASGDATYIDDIGGGVIYAFVTLAAAVRYRTLVTRWYAVAVTNERVFFVRLRPVPKDDGRPLMKISRPAIVDVGRVASQREQRTGEGGADGRGRAEMQPDGVEWIEARSAVTVTELRSSGLSGLLRLGRPEGSLELSFDRARLASAQAVALALGAPPELVRVGTASRRRLVALLMDFALGFSFFGWLGVVVYVFGEIGVLAGLVGVLALLVVVPALVVARLAIGRPYVTASGCLAAVAGFMAGSIALGLSAVALGF